MDQEITSPNTSHHETLHPLKEITFGATSGMVGKVVEFPLDTIKVRLQSAGSSGGLTTLQMIKTTYHNEGLFNGFYKVDTIKSNIQTHDLFNNNRNSNSMGKHMGFWQTTRSIITKPGGILNLYNGLGITMVRCIPANALIFYTYELLKQNF